MAWQDKVDPMIKSHLEKQIRETLRYREAFMDAADPADAQLWCAIADLGKQMFDINLKLTYLERALKDIGKTKKPVKRTRKRVTRKKKK